MVCSLPNDVVYTLPSVEVWYFCSRAASVLESYKLHQKGSCQLPTVNLAEQRIESCDKMHIYTQLVKEIFIFSYFHQIFCFFMHLFWKENSNFSPKKLSRKFLCRAFPAALLLWWAQAERPLRNNKLCFWNGAQVLYGLF